MKKLLLLALVCVATDFYTQAQKSDEPLWDTDITVKKETGEKYTKPVVNIDYKGNIFIGRLVKIGSSINSTKWEVLKSTDKGSTFTVFASGSAPTNNKITAFDMIVTGNKVANFRVFVSVGFIEDSTSTARLFAKGYKEDGSIEELSFHNESFTTYKYRGITSLSWASDSRSPNNSATDYTISLAAAKSAELKDSIIVYTSNTSLINFKRVQSYYTHQFINNISSSIGRKKSNDDGRLIVFWNEYKEREDSFAQSGYIGINPKSGDIEIPAFRFSDPIERLASTALAQDNLGDGFKGLLLVNYKISSGSSDNSAVQYDFETTYSFSSVQRYDSSNTYGRALHTLYDVKEKRYLYAFYNTKTKSIDIYAQPLYGPTGEPATLIKSKVRNATTAITDPELKIDNYGSANGLGTVVVWNSNGTIMMDYELKEPVNIKESQNINDITIYPNPARELINLHLNAQSSDQLQIQIVDVTGKVLGVYSENVLPGLNHLKIQTKNLESGNYFLQLINKGGNQTLPFTIVK